MLPILAVLTCPAALADPVIYVGDSAGVAERAATTLGVGADKIELVEAMEIVASAGPTILGHGRATSCTGPAQTMVQIAKLQEQAEKALQYQDLESAEGALSKAIDSMVCLSDPLSPGTVARLHYLEGMAAVARHDKPGAWDAFYAARLFEPDMAWDDNFPPDGKNVFELAGKEVAGAALSSFRVVPTPRSMLIDGRAIDSAVDLPPGDHLVQIGSEPLLTYRITIDAESDLVFLLPDIYEPQDKLGPQAAAVLAQLAALRYRNGETVYLAGPRKIWKATAGQPDLLDVAEPAAAAAAPSEPPAAEPPAVEPTTAEPPPVETPPAQPPASEPPNEAVATTAEPAAAEPGEAPATATFVAEGDASGAGSRFNGRLAATGGMIAGGLGLGALSTLSYLDYRSNALEYNADQTIPEAFWDENVVPAMWRSGIEGGVGALLVVGAAVLWQTAPVSVGPGTLTVSWTF